MSDGTAHNSDSRDGNNDDDDVIYLNVDFSGPASLEEDGGPINHMQDLLDEQNDVNMAMADSSEDDLEDDLEEWAGFGEDVEKGGDRRSSDDHVEENDERSAESVENTKSSVRKGLEEPSHYSRNEANGCKDFEGSIDLEESDGASLDESIGDDERNLIPPASPEVVEKTRLFLKKHGSVRFLETYLPTTATASDIVGLISKLGFVLRQQSYMEDDNRNIMEYVKILQHAMTKVSAERDRLPTAKTFEDALDLIQKSHKILVITGAGISTSLGIPDFRSSQGFYSMVQHLGLSDPQEVFDLLIFNSDPSLFYSIAHMVLPPENTFSPLHSFIYLLQQKGKLLRNYTQNIDNLESYAGIVPEKMVQCHGSFATATCVTCRNTVAGETIFKIIRQKEIPYCPRCEAKKKSILKKNDDYYFPESYGVYKPDITFFGEALPSRFHDLINTDISECDLLISIGTSLKVAPVADIVDKIPQNIPQILINRDPIDHCNFDISLLGYCDDVAALVSHRLGDDWKLPHKDFDKIRGKDGENLTVRLINSQLREYKIESNDAEQRSKEEHIAEEHNMSV